MKNVIITILSVLLGFAIFFCWSDIDYRYGYQNGRRDTARTFARAELKGKVYVGRPLIFSHGADINNCWFIGYSENAMVELWGDNITLSNFYIDCTDDIFNPILIANKGHFWCTLRLNE
jgi:hypothetical protein